MDTEESVSVFLDHGDAAPLRGGSRSRSRPRRLTRKRSARGVMRGGLSLFKRKTSSTTKSSTATPAAKQKAAANAAAKAQAAAKAKADGAAKAKAAANAKKARDAVMAAKAKAAKAAKNAKAQKSSTGGITSGLVPLGLMGPGTIPPYAGIPPGYEPQYGPDGELLTYGENPEVAASLKAFTTWDCQLGPRPGCEDIYENDASNEAGNNTGEGVEDEEIIE